MSLKSGRIMFAVAFILCMTFSSFAQNDDRWFVVDEFGRIPNDDLLARVDNFWEAIRKQDGVGIVVLYGPPTAKYLNQRRIEGCNLMRRYPKDNLRFVFGPDEHETTVRLIVEPRDHNLIYDPPNYKLTDLKKPIELNLAFATDEFCPLHFDRIWYAHFLHANPGFSGKVVISVRRRKTFVNRVSKYRKELTALGIAGSRIRYLNKRFDGERDEQWLLIPGKSK